jgi:hypothetical protein
VFLTLMVMGLVGLVVMAIPAFGHGHAPHAGTMSHGGHGGHGGHVGHAPAPTPGKEIVPADTSDSPGSTMGLVRFLPSPRAICSVFALYGAFGNALVDAAHLPFVAAALAAVIPALAIERFAVTPLWNMLFRLQGKPSAPLAELILGEATAVTPFRNGRGIVAIMRDGRLVQLSARLRPDEATLPVNVGERLRVEDVEAGRERVTVSLLRAAPARRAPGNGDA